jgi:hypothetical protein
LGQLSSERAFGGLWCAIFLSGRWGQALFLILYQFPGPFPVILWVIPLALGSLLTSICGFRISLETQRTSAAVLCAGVAILVLCPCSPGTWCPQTLSSASSVLGDPRSPPCCTTTWKFSLGSKREHW